MGTGAGDEDSRVLMVSLECDPEAPGLLLTSPSAPWTGLERERERVTGGSQRHSLRDPGFSQPPPST